MNAYSPDPALAEWITSLVDERISAALKSEREKELQEWDEHFFPEKTTQ